MRPPPRRYSRSPARLWPLRRGPSRSSGRSVPQLAKRRRSPGSGRRAAPRISRRTSSRQPSPGGSADTARSGASPLLVWYLRRALKHRQQHEDGSDSPEGRCRVARLSRSACKPGTSPSEATEYGRFASRATPRCVQPRFRGLPDLGFGRRRSTWVHTTRLGAAACSQPPPVPRYSRQGRPTGAFLERASAS